MRYHSVNTLSLLLCCAIACLFFGCSNSEGIDYVEWDERDFVRTSSNVIEEYNNSPIVQSSEESDESSSSKAIDLLSVSSEKNELSSSSKNIDKRPLDDTEYPYAGIPRIVIETEGHREIKDRETEIPAKLQIWGEKAPESEIMELTIRGRGNSTWNKPKKPYTIKFEQKQIFLGMKKAKKWVLLANYFDRTLIRNAVAFEIARRTNLEWTPEGKFADVFLNGKPLGNYFVCEKIQVDQNRLNINDNSYLLEFDSHYDEKNKFKTKIKNHPINIKNPNHPTQMQLDYIQNYIDTVESILFLENKNLAIENYLDLQSFADFLIVYEITQNSEPLHPKSVFVYKDATKIKAGPVWDFDWGTFIEEKKGWQTGKTLWFKPLLSNSNFKTKIIVSWNTYKNKFEDIPSFIDSIANYTRYSNNQNIAKWPTNVQSSSLPDRNKNFDEAIIMLKETFSARLVELDSLINNL